MPDISIREIERISKEALLRHGANEKAADVMADAIAWAEARRNRICGLYYLESYCRQLETGRINRDAVPSMEAVRPSVLKVHADDGFAQVAFDATFDQAVKAARDSGIVSVNIGRSHTCTALGWFTERAASAGLIALGVTNASPIVAPFGGSKRVIGTNPIAFAVPDGAGGVAFAFDQATTVVTLGAVNMAKEAGEPIPEGWAVDSEGNATTDPEAALKGSLLSAGGAKGWGIGAMVEILAAGLTGGRLSQDVKPLKAPEGDPHDLGQVFILIDPGTSPDFADRLAGLVAGVEADGRGRLPGYGRKPLEAVAVPDALWTACESLAGA
ncbi:MAG: Ldh family oxidoreductase [Boseongicola sp.]|nr:Ldh family oxidoreductase [Boseongicola sp.]